MKESDVSQYTYKSRTPRPTGVVSDPRKKNTKEKI